MPKFEVIILLLIAAAVWFWFDSLKAREAGIRAVREACEEEGLQLLDETIGLISLKLARDGRGRFALRRVYGFEYSDTGDNRRRGAVHLLGATVTMLNIGLRLVASDGRLTGREAE